MQQKAAVKYENEQTQTWVVSQFCNSQIIPAHSSPMHVRIHAHRLINTLCLNSITRVTRSVVPSAHKNWRQMIKKNIQCINLNYNRVKIT